MSALEFQDRTLTFAPEIDDRSNPSAHLFTALGLKTGATASASTWPTA